MLQTIFAKALLVAFLISIIFACKDRAGSAAPDSELVILISIDGFRHDYIDLTETPAMDRMIESGVRAESLIPVFPTKTFPNHYTIVTGLYPEHHGIIANSMYDSVFQESFYIGAGSFAAQDGKWYGGEPIWVTAEKQNKIAATYFWPGSDAAIQGVRPTRYEVFDNNIPYTKRVNKVISWLQLKPSEQPDFISLYFESVDSEGHQQGPASEAALAEVRAVDAQLGRLLDGIDGLGLTDHVNIIVVSDHGMSQLSRDRIIFMDDYVNTDDVSIINWSPVTDITPKPGKHDEVLAALTGAHPHFTVFAKEDMPDSLHYRAHRRIAPIIGIADDGWSVTEHDYFDERPNAFTGGTHGFAPQHESMHGVLIATGPSFARGKTVTAIESIDLYELMCHILSLTPAENDGDLLRTSVMLQ